MPPMRPMRTTTSVIRSMFGPRRVATNAPRIPCAPVVLPQFWLLRQRLEDQVNAGVISEDVDLHLNGEMQAVGAFVDQGISRVDGDSMMIQRGAGTTADIWRPVGDKDSTVHHFGGRLNFARSASFT